MNARDVVQPVRKLRKLLRGSWRMPAPKRVHELRTGARKYETIVQVLRCDTKQSERRPLRAVKRIRRRAGTVRDLDVLTNKARTLEIPDEQDCLVLLLERLGADRVRQARKLKRIIERQRPSLRRQLKQTARRLERRLSKSKQNRAGAGVAATLLATAVASMAELAAPMRLNHQTLHPYRLKVKELRDVLRIAAGDDQAGLVKLLGDVKDAIGEWHDWETLIEIAAEIVDADHGTICAVGHQLKAIAREKFEHAVWVTRQMRRRLIQGLSNFHRGGAEARRLSA